MVFTTRAFIVSIQKILEEVGGLGSTATIMYRAGFKSGYQFAKEQRTQFNLSWEELFKRYELTGTLAG